MTDDGPVEELVEVMTRYGGVARAKGLAEAGISRRAIEAGIAAGLIRRVRAGLYAVPEAPVRGP